MHDHCSFLRNNARAGAALWERRGGVGWTATVAGVPDISFAGDALQSQNNEISFIKIHYH